MPIPLPDTEIHRLTQLYPPPEYVKSASSQRLLGDASMPPHVYADQGRQEFPMHTAGAVWLSAARFFEKAGTYAPKEAERIRERLLDAAAYYGVRGDVAALEEKVAAAARYTLDQLPDDDFAYVWETEDGHKERRLPLRNPSEVQKAAGWLQTNHLAFPFAARRRVAERILEKSAALQVSLSADMQSWLATQSGQGMCSLPQAQRLLMSREQRLKQAAAPVRRQLAEMQAQLLAEPAVLRQPETLYKLAELLDEIDTLYDLHAEYGKTLEPPEALFQLRPEQLEKIASEHVSLTSGTIYQTQDLARVRVSDLAEHMADLANAVTADGIHLDLPKLAAIVPTLPRGDAERFDRLIQSLGITPAYKQAALQRQGLTEAQLLELAAEYPG